MGRFQSWWKSPEILVRIETSLVIRWLRICLPVQGMQEKIMAWPSLVGELESHMPWDN